MLVNALSFLRGIRFLPTPRASTPHEHQQTVQRLEPGQGLRGRTPRPGGLPPGKAGSIMFRPTDRDHYSRIASDSSPPYPSIRQGIHLTLTSAMMPRERNLHRIELLFDDQTKLSRFPAWRYPPVWPESPTGVLSVGMSFSHFSIANRHYALGSATL